MCLSILACLLCFPIGVIALIFSVQVRIWVMPSHPMSIQFYGLPLYNNPHKPIYSYSISPFKSDKAEQQKEWTSLGSWEVPPSLLHCSLGDCYGMPRHAHLPDFAHDRLIFSVTSSSIHEQINKYILLCYWPWLLSIQLCQMRFLLFHTWRAKCCQSELAMWGAC